MNETPKKYQEILQAIKTLNIKNISERILYDLDNKIDIETETIERIMEKIETLKIKKILVVDDNLENIMMAKAYFNNFPVRIEYATNVKQAQDMITQAYQESKYDLVLTDLEMETSTSGVDVLREAFAHQAQGFVITGKNYDAAPTDPHGPTTQILGYIDSKMRDPLSIPFKKNEVGTWEAVFEFVLDYMSKEGLPTYEAMQRYHKFVGKPMDTTNSLVDGLVYVRT